MKQFLSANDVTDVSALVKRALEIKAQNLNGDLKSPKVFNGKTIVLLFFNPSLRTRLSTEKAALNLGMNVITMNADQGWQLEFEEGTVMNLDRAEHVKEAAQVISQYADLIGVRTFPTLTNREQDYNEFVMKQFVKYATAPVISLESATLHPLQSLTDVMTIDENKSTARPKVVLTWAPHPRALPQAVANSFVEWMKKTDVELVVTHPKGAELAPQFMENLTIEYNQLTAFEGAHFIYAKNWSSYYDYGKIITPSKDWMVTTEKMALTDGAKFMHCLPVRRNFVVSDDVIDHSNSIVIKQAANREFAAQAVIEDMLINTINN